jgi:hypothetical protein
MFTWNFLRQTAERAVKVYAESLAALLLASKTGLLDAPWGSSLSVAGMAALVSVLVSIASRPVGAPDSPSLVQLGTPNLDAVSGADNRFAPPGPDPGATDEPPWKIRPLPSPEPRPER